jgi:hypothetical protein
MTRADRYRRQAEVARRSISQWPEWMQHTITPPQEDIPHLVEKPAATENDRASQRAGGAEPNQEGRPV